MPEFPVEPPKILALYLQISQYPILAHQIRRRMRDELYRRGVITPARLEQEARDKAVLSQQREGLVDPFGEEDSSAWEQRLQQIRDHLTDFYFAYNLPLELFHRIVEELLAGRRSALPDKSPSWDEITLTFNPELAPVDLLIRKIEQYASVPLEERSRVQHHIEEMNVVLIKALISDQLSFVGVAKKWLDAEDFQFILARRIGSGKIGGKAAGMLLAWKILHKAAPQLLPQLRLPRSYFIGADVFYEYLALNKVEYINQKYKAAEQVRADYPQIRAEYEQGRFPEEIADALRDILREVGDRPLIVRSSSLLEDNFGTSFAGKYDSYFCPNQGTLKENLRDLTLAIRRIYASVYSPDALIYRRRMGLLDYDERMAILLQEVQGEIYHDYFFPTLAGVAFSRSPIVWSPRLRREEGFLRLVLGLGTRAVERVGEDYPRLLFLSHPQLRPETTPAAIAHYSQRLMDVIDLESNTLRTVPVREALDLDFPALRWTASVWEDETLLPLKSLSPRITADNLVLTFDALIQRTDFVPLVKNVLSTLAHNYGFPVDVEFTAALRPAPGGARPNVEFSLLQCRPQSTGARGETVRVPTDLPAADQLFLTTRMVPQGHVSQVEYILYVAPEVYDGADAQRRQAIARLIGQLNKRLEGQAFILIGPGRWGSSNIQLGVPVSYADIFNARALVELSMGRGAAAPEPSYGTHFFQDLVETNIHPLAIYPDEPGDFLNRGFLDSAQDRLAEFAGGEAAGVRVIRVSAERPGQTLEIAMDGEKALAYFATAE
ncbi:MAG: PEP/pyruvate-binding domain-containing protein [Anaerolineales bacterium]|nr:PEP/pyruvate-binding domain-containing protein [Anaerolineales bacterium]